MISPIDEGEGLIIARLKPRTNTDGTRYLCGTWCVDSEIKRGTIVVLRKDGDGYTLSEVRGFDRPARVTDEMLHSFIVPE